jgi:hypothetical protein
MQIREILATSRRMEERDLLMRLSTTAHVRPWLGCGGLHVRVRACWPACVLRVHLL